MKDKKVKKETQAEKIEKMIDKALEKVLESKGADGMSICNNSFVGVKFDEKAAGAIHTIAEGLVENAKALGSLATVLKASNVNIETMIRVDNG